MCKTISIKLAKLIMVIVPLLALFTYINKNIIINLGNKLPECYFYKSTGYLCPACGNTRSIISLLRGNIVKSIQYNITPLLLLIIAFSFYIELIAYVLGKKITICPRSYTFLGSMLGLLAAYYLLRNIFHCLTIS